MTSRITIVHFNDVYNIEPRKVEPVGGAARFVTAIKHLAPFNPMVLFSGDALAPSLISTFTKGQQMIPVLNALGIHCAVYGNHDFDFGDDELQDVAKENNFPWLMSNVIDNNTNAPLADGKIKYILNWEGKKFGIIGLVEAEWIDTLATISPEDITYTDYVTEGRKLAQELKQQGCDYIIALTHMRFPNDVRLAENVDEIDLILGGHDHCYEVKRVNGRYVIKSGTDFRQFSKITLIFNPDQPVDVSIEEVNITSEYEEDPEIKAVVDKYLAVVDNQMETILGNMDVELDGRFANIRTKETNLGNFVTDIMLSSTHSDLAILNSGTLRSDMVHSRGTFKMRDLMNILPMLDPLMVIKANGRQILEALENGVSQYPKHEGRFLQVSGVSFAFDPSKPSGERVDPKHVKIGDEYLEVEQDYRLCTKSYLAQGKDGFTCLKDCEVLVSEDEGPQLHTAIQNHFNAIKILTGVKSTRTGHRQSLVCLSRRHSLVRANEEAHQPPLREFRHMSLDIKSTFMDLRQKRARMMTRQSSLHEVEMEQTKLAPKVEGRITIITDDLVLERLNQERESYNSLLNTDVTVILEDEEIADDK